jgi:GAF domain-containing protein
LFVPAAQHGGFAAVHAVPLRLREQVLGALNLFGAHPGALHGDDLDLAQALAHVASVALVQEKAAGDKDLIVAQLTAALASRVVLEQAKGVLAERGGIEMDAAFSALRLFARDNNQRLTAVAAAVAGRALAPTVVLEHVARRARRHEQAPVTDR